VRQNSRVNIIWVVKCSQLVQRSAWRSLLLLLETLDSFFKSISNRIGVGGLDKGHSPLQLLVLILHAVFLHGRWRVHALLKNVVVLVVVQVVTGILVVFGGQGVRACIEVVLVVDVEGHSSPDLLHVHSLVG